ncbi:phosphoribosylamine--glycine ligase [Oenococcus sicerae]|uniref:Phosphoribosylamine--glycine ligase n=1 Tax=Oenococcus sicerae TaxID=2203724 RepID=A0AAJ1VLV0_9LACO|nr:phosphoribosylamine--glycine ligase [Oenococcus sicerae]MDN6899873.1 phosphoribosylamine--glycine ligase [Oenococcus sicerae]QAS70557.1 phosphoribosylamine--glycine ligase [Oenococcus sicerae]
MAKVLIIGAGAREHALAKTFVKSPQVEQVYVAPGNDGMISAGIQTVAIAVDQLTELAAFAQKKKIDLTFVGSEEPLVLGVVDVFKQAGLRIFGPSKQAARLEGSKTFAKNILKEAKVKTADFDSVNSLAQAQAILAKHDLPVVFKLDGLAAGKGVTIISDRQAAKDYLVNLYAKFPHEDLVIEEFMQGIEFSFFSLIGENGAAVHLPPAQDHKRRFDHDKGPNTGGMGAYSPVAEVSEMTIHETIKKIVEPSLKAMCDQGCPFIGVLYTGLMLTKSGPKVVEFNVRFGDPETQAILPQLQGDFYQLILDLLDGKQPLVNWQTTDVFLAVVLSAPGYPADVKKGFLTPLSAQLPAAIDIDYAAVTKSASAFLSNGGRVATLVTHAKTAAAAQKQLYHYLDQAALALDYRHDIGYQLVDFERQTQGK